MDLAASIWHKPGTFEELYKRGINSLKGVSEYNFNLCLGMTKSKNWIYKKGEIYYCYKSTVVNVLNPNGYEIELPVDQRSDFRKEFDRLFGR